MNRLESMQKCFDAIMALKGADEIKLKMTELHEILKDKEPYALLNSLPNFMIVARQGGGISTVVNAVAKYLSAANAIEFSGKEKWFYFKVDYAERGEQFKEIDRFLKTLTALKGYNRHFKGVAYINLDKWLEQKEVENLQKFLSYLSSIDEMILFFLGVHTDNQNLINNMETMIARYIRIETLKMRFPDSRELTEILMSLIEDKGFSFTEDVHILTEQLLSNIQEKNNFYGFKTLEQLSVDIIYHFFKINENNLKQITTETIENYRDNSIYLKQFLYDVSLNTNIGFAR